MKKVAVVLTGCGAKDGSEINEAVTLLLALDQHDIEYQAFAPDAYQAEVCLIAKLTTSGAIMKVVNTIAPASTATSMP